MDRLLLALLLIALIYGGLAALVYRAARRAPLGYEDEAGFHEGAANEAHMALGRREFGDGHGGDVAREGRRDHV